MAGRQVALDQEALVLGIEDGGLRSATLRRNIQTPRGCPVTYTAKKETTIAVGHQSGKDLHDEVYLSVYT